MNEIVEAIIERKLQKNNIIVGIDGLGGSGKTTLVENISLQLEGEGYAPLILHLDDFIHPRNIRYNDNYEQWYCYYNLQWRYDYFIDQIIRPLTNATVETERTIELYDMEKDGYITKIISYNPNKSIILVEGIFLHRPEIRDLFDFTIYIDVPREVRLSRVTERDTYIGNSVEIKDKYESRYFPAEEWYIHNVKPKEMANYVLNMKELT